MPADQPPPTKKPHKPYNRKYNRKRVLELAKQGISQGLIAKDQNIDISSVSRFLSKTAPELKEIHRFTSLKPDLLALSQAKKQTVENMIIDSWLGNPDILLSQDIRLQKEVVHTLQGGRHYDLIDERLERGQSTDNISVQSIAGELSDTLAEYHQRSQQLRGVMRDRMMDIGDVDEVGG